jgi:MFS family permease
VIVFYATVVLESVGLSRNSAIIAGGCLNLAFAVGSLVPALGADKLGRKKPMMFGAAGMGISMMLVAILLSFQGKAQAQPTGEAAIAFLIIYMICFGTSLNAIPWCYSTEILPLRIRAQGTALVRALLPSRFLAAGSANLQNRLFSTTGSGCSPSS